MRPEGATWTMTGSRRGGGCGGGGLCSRCCSGTGGTRQRACRSRRPARPSFAPTGDGAAGAPGPGGWGRALRRQRASMGDRVFWSVLKSLADLPTRRGEALDGSGTFLEESDTSNEIQALARERTAEKFWATWHIERPRTARSQGGVSTIRDCLPFIDIFLYLIAYDMIACHLSIYFFI